MDVITLAHGDGRVVIEEIGSGLRRVSVIPNSDDTFVHDWTWDTAYPVDLIKTILHISGVGYLCFEIMREEDEKFVQKLITNDIAAYFGIDDFSNARILDFGSGSGASSVLLARLFPSARIVGIELVGEYIHVAEQRAKFYGLSDRVTFVRSPGPSMLPADLGTFDLVVMSAVYEHLLPAERSSIMPQLWKLVRKGGFMFINQTPDIRFPLELHTTMLPGINYMPDRLAHVAATRFSKRIKKGESWENLLRMGIRGATEKEILRMNGPGDERPVLLEPNATGLSDRIDLYYKNTDPVRLRLLKTVSRKLLKVLRKVSGICLVPDLSLAIQKPTTATQTKDLICTR
jgi:2-polyprenyl-3-methyl-5-hydroxy-6-metoxy-1,4-benzoquinol methylase